MKSNLQKMEVCYLYFHFVTTVGDSLLLFSVPFVAPTILSLKRTSATSAHIKWEQLKPQDLRGNTSYQIFYVVDKCQAVFSLSDDSTPPIEVLNTEYLLSNVFEPQYEYCVGITAITSAGTGPFQSMTLSCKYKL